MLGNLIFDESVVNTAFRVCTRPQTKTSGTSTAFPAATLSPRETTARLHDGGNLLPAHDCLFGCRGEVVLPSLQANLLWWLDADANAVQLLVVNDTESSTASRSCQTRLLTVEFPFAAANELVTCGVTRNYMGDNSVSVVWVQRGFAGEADEKVLCPGYVQVTAQRDADNSGHSNLLLVPDEHVIQCAPLSRNPFSAFENASQYGSCGAVVALLPEDASPRTISIVVLTDGSRTWRVELRSDGASDVIKFRDEHRRNFFRSFCDGNEEIRLIDTRTVAADLERMLGSPSPAEGEISESTTAALRGSTWMGRLLGGSRQSAGDGAGSGCGTSAGDGAVPLGVFASSGLPAAIKKRLYVAVSAVQHTAFVALTRWNGQVEVYDVANGDLKLTPEYPIGMLPHALLRSNGDSATFLGGELSSSAGARGQGLLAVPTGPVMQWATRSHSTNVLQVVTCFSGGEGRSCFWTSLPPTMTSASSRMAGELIRDAEVLAQHCTLSLAAPTLSSFPLACTVTGDGRRLVLVSDTGIEEDGHLLCTRTLGTLTLRGEQLYADGVVTVVQVMDAAVGAGLGDVVRMGSTRGYLCQGTRLQSVMACGTTTLMVERGPTSCRLYTFEEAAGDVVREVNEGVVVGVDDEDVHASGCSLEEEEERGGNGAVMPHTGGALRILHRVHYVPLMESPLVRPEASVTPTRTSADPFALYWEGINVVQACSHGSRLMADLLQDVLLATTPIKQLSSLPRFLSEVHLSGYTAALQRHDPMTHASVCAAIRLALSPSSASVSESHNAFYHYNRLYVTHATIGDIMSRIIFLTTTYLGWQSTCSVAFTPHISSEWGAADTPVLTTTTTAECISQQLIGALEMLVAAHHAIPVAGADLVQLMGDARSLTGLSSAAIVAALLPAVPPTAVDSKLSEVGTLAMVRVANRLRRCGTPAATQACAVWVKHLTHRFPLLLHYELLLMMETSAAATQPERVLALCRRVSQALSQESPANVASLLVMEGLLLTDVSSPGSSFLRVPLEELAAWIAADPCMAPSLYAIGVLRRGVPNATSQSCLGDGVIRNFFYATLGTCMESLERLSCATPSSAASFPLLRRAMEDLQVEVLLAGARARVSEGDIACCFHDLQTALDIISKNDMGSVYAEVLQAILSQVVETASSSQSLMNALLRTTTIGAAQLEELLILRWYNYIARLPTKSASVATEALRYRTIMGLHRYLVDRHSYAQCARLMSSLATLICCSPLRRSASAGISVGELAGLALHAAEMIAPSAPVLGSTANKAEVASSFSSKRLPLTSALIVGSPLSLGYSWQPSTSASSAPADPFLSTGSDAVARPRWLTRADIPWLRRRLYQAHCERQLWRRGYALDCTDLWVEGAPEEAYQAAVRKLVTALMQARLWPLAFRFARLSSAFDPCDVLVEWAVDLLRTSLPQEGGIMAVSDAAHADRMAAWTELIAYCVELSNLENQFYAFVQTVKVALVHAYERVPAALLDAHRTADAYTAMTTLFHVALLLRKRVEAEERQASESRDGAAEEDVNSSSHSSLDSNAAGVPVKSHNTTLSSLSPLEAARRNVWRAWCGAAQIAMEVLQKSDHSDAPTPADGGMATTPTTKMEAAAGVGSVAEAALDAGCRGARRQVVRTSSSAARQTFSAFTAGTLDPMMVCVKELLATPAYALSLKRVDYAEETVNRFLHLLQNLS